METRAPHYNTVHRKLKRERGKASEHLCVGCGKQARDWAYMYREGVPEYTGYRGNKYTDDLSCYSPMCRSCHVKHDMEKDPVAMERRREGNRRGDKRAGGKAFAARLKSDPEFAAEMEPIRQQAAVLGAEAVKEKYRALREGE